MRTREDWTSTIALCQEWWCRQTRIPHPRIDNSKLFSSRRSFVSLFQIISLIKNWGPNHPPVFKLVRLVISGRCTLDRSYHGCRCVLLRHDGYLSSNPIILGRFVPLRRIRYGCCHSPAFSSWVRLPPLRRSDVRRTSQRTGIFPACWSSNYHWHSVPYLDLLQWRKDSYSK